MRLTRIDEEDLNLFEFDYDLTFMVFFLNADEKVYGRYGGRDAESPDRRQSLAGLRYTMQSVLDVHNREDKVFAPKTQDTPRYLRDMQNTGRRGRCLHCHQVKEVLNRDLERTGKWSRDSVWRYPLPENLGFDLEVDRGNVVRLVKEKTPASAVGLAAGDVVRQLNGVPVHSQGDAQYALDRAPTTGSIALTWQHGDKLVTDKLALPEGWRKSDITWRPSMQRLVPSARLYGTDLTAQEKQALGLSERQLAFRQRDSVPAQAREAGVRAGDIIVGVDAAVLETDVDGFLRFVQRQYLVGDRVTLHVVRDGKRMDLTMTLLR